MSRTLKDKQQEEKKIPCEKKDAKDQWVTSTGYNINGLM